MYKKGLFDFGIEGVLGECLPYRRSSGLELVGGGDTADNVVVRVF